MSNASGPVLLALHRIGPYHHARVLAAARRLPLEVLETRPHSQEYPWEFSAAGSYPIHRLSGAADPEQDPPRQAVDQQLEALLTRLQPRAVLSVGWADRTYQRLLLACQRRRLPLLLVSDSRWRDQPRSLPLELLKAQLLRGYSGALVAGRESRAYLEQLGMPAAVIEQPWDVVDNAAFAAPSGTPASPARRPELLCVSRFVAKKNHLGLLEAYGRYQREGGRWGLRLIGSGPLEAEIRAAAARLPQPERIVLEPFRQLEALRQAYAAAAGFVLASHTDQWGLVVNEAMAAGLPVLVSSACGCHADLITEGVTGWGFDPADPAALCAAIHRLERLSAGERSAVVAAARQRLEAFSPEAFAAGLERALERAMAPALAGARPRSSRRASLSAALLSRR
jgi:glycosyltransferase involved in cell wall biosynthesis